MKKSVVCLLLWLLNSRWLNPSPCSYGFIGNVEAFSIEHLRCEESQRSGITVATIIREAEEFRACPICASGFTVLENGVPRQGNVRDIEDLRRALQRIPPAS